MTPSVDRSTQLFVYGTLRPGDVRWHILEPFVDDSGRTATVAGRLYDTGRGYPAAVFDSDPNAPTGAIIHGLVYPLRRHRIDAALSTLDHVEGTVAGLYRRISVRTTRGDQVWAYEYGSGLDLTPIPSGDWLRR